MALYADIDKPLSAEHPCGPDPDLDPDVMNFLAVAEGQLPASYREFNKKAFEAKPTLKSLADHLEKSRDLRYLVLAAKYHILADDLAGFGEAVGALSRLLAAQWEACHPTEKAGGVELRAAYLRSLDDLPTSVLPFQNATLFNDKRAGPITVRMVLVATKKLAARAGETATDEGTIRDSFMRIEPLETVMELHGGLTSIVANLDTIRQIFIDKAGHASAPSFDQLKELAQSIKTYITDIVNTRAPSPEPAIAVAEGSEEAAADADSSTGPSPATPAGPVPDIGSVKEASNALQAALAYYAAQEPSSPARLLLKQAHQLVGKSFLEAMKILAPAMVEKAKIQIGGDAPFSLNFAQLSALAADDAKAAKDEAEARTYSAASRAEAVGLMRKVEQFYRQTEPSSPIPLLVERARNFVAKDFTELLKEMSKKDEPPPKGEKS